MTEYCPKLIGNKNTKKDQLYEVKGEMNILDKKEENRQETEFVFMEPIKQNNNTEFKFVKMSETCNSMFQGVAYQLTGNEDNQDEVREYLASHMGTNKLHFSQLLEINKDDTHILLHIV